MAWLGLIVFIFVFMIFFPGLLYAKSSGHSKDWPDETIIFSGLKATASGFKITAAVIFMFYIFMPNIINNYRETLFASCVGSGKTHLASSIIVTALIYLFAYLDGILIRFYDTQIKDNEDDPIILKLIKILIDYRKVNKDPYVKIKMENGKEYQGECMFVDTKKETIIISSADNPGKEVSILFDDVSNINVVN